jgi:HEAT repeat protein
MRVDTPRRAGRRVGAREVALAAARFVACAGGLESLARLRQPERRAPAPYITDWQDWDGEFYTVKSTAVGWPPWEDYNTEGLRDREHALAKRPSAWRVACLGDSVTLGFGIRPQEAWPQKLEQLAAAQGRDLVRLAAVTSLVELRAQAEVAEPALLQALRDPDRRIRQQAVRGIGRFEALSPRARSGLEAASRDADPAVREKAGQVLARVAPAHGG